MPLQVHEALFLFVYGMDSGIGISMHYEHVPVIVCELEEYEIKLYRSFIGYL